MTISFLPRIMVKDVTALTEEQLQSWDIKLLMLDFDNTVVPYTTNVPTKQVYEWMENLKKSNIHLCVVSNSNKDRVKNFCRKYHIDCVWHARKPFSTGILECVNRYQIPVSECALVGDQIFTDVLGANCCGVKSILVPAIDNHNFWLKARHVLELPFIYVAKKRRIIHEKS